MAKNPKKQKKKQNDYFFMMKHIRFAWGYVALALILGVAQSAVVSALPNQTAELFNGDFNPAKLGPVFSTLIWTLVLAVGTYLFRLLAESKSTLACRNAVWEQMNRVKADYYDSHDPASLLSMVTVDAQTIGVGVVQLFVFVPTVLALALACILQLLAYEAKLLLVLVILIPLHIIYLFFIGKWQARVGKELSGTIGTLTGYLAERIRNLPMIKSFSVQERECENGQETAKKLYNVSFEYNGKLAAVVNGYQILSAVLSVILPVIWGASLLRQGEIDTPTFLAFSTYVVTINTTFLTISIIWGFVKDFAGRAYRIARLIEAPKETPIQKGKQKKKAQAAQIPQGDIQLNDLSFRYQTGSPVLQTISAVIPAGKVTAIVGPSGSGKTTLIKLLERLYEPTEGTVTCGGTDISALDLIAWRKKLAYAVQDAAVFSGTVKEAFTYSTSEEIGQEQLEQAAKAVGMYDFIMGLPQQFDTPLSGWGGSLSGGQRQRIVIGRVLLQNADILIFDEPTSALDPEAAAAVGKLIFDNFRGKTVMIISHELSFVAGADQILMIENGQLVEAGTHSQLMQSCEAYRSLVQQQSYQEVFGV